MAYIAVTSATEPGLKAVVPFYAPHDLVYRVEQQETVDEALQAFLNPGPAVTPGTLSALKKASPYDHVQGNVPPILMIRGTADEQVAYDQSVRMLARSREAGVTADGYAVKGGKHGIGSWDKIPGGEAYKQYLVNWLNKTLR